MQKYVEVRRDVFLNTADLMLHVGMRRVCATGVETVREIDPLLKAIEEPDAGEKQSNRALAGWRVGMAEFVERSRSGTGSDI
jgi:hypothetical protein